MVCWPQTRPPPLHAVHTPPRRQAGLASDQPSPALVRQAD
ncbi:unnamed protein product [Protopolystoma xenopodis]|uniref:Uncharacterized protein n=1 Tax=Protopolystoma xenopodis TaxID=117903 RepID=A0A448XPV1_9PLAT|nr:unnamed protein product [Protopolystoma xenopodis]